MKRPKQRWFEDYTCGCVSEMVNRKRDLLGYCPVHGADRRHVWPEQTPKPEDDDVKGMGAKHE